MFLHQYRARMPLSQCRKIGKIVGLPYRNKQQTRYTRQSRLRMGVIAGGFVASGIMSITISAVARADDVSELLTQGEQELIQADAYLAQAISSAEASRGGTAAVNELSSLSAQQDFQQELGVFLNSLPTNIPEADETSTRLIDTLQLLDGNLGEAWMVNNDASLAENVVNGGQALSLTFDNLLGLANDGAITGWESAVQIAFGSLGL
jgi:hypothetical protein